MRQIIAMGGGGFSMEPTNPLLDEYILNQSQSAKPKICFLPTASGDAQGYIDRFYESFEKFVCEPTHLSLFSLPKVGPEELLLAQDIIYVGGGNTKSMLAVWTEWGLDVILRNAWEQGTILTGLSAGSICWFEEGLTDSYGEALQPLKCLGFLPGSHSPHYDSEETRRPIFHHLIASGAMMGGFGADDGAGLHFIDDKLFTVVSSRPNAKGYSVKMIDGKLVEQEIDTRYLGE
jgi:peptidase E